MMDLSWSGSAGQLLLDTIRFILQEQESGEILLNDVVGKGVIGRTRAATMSNAALNIFYRKERDALYIYYQSIKDKESSM